MDRISPIYRLGGIRLETEDGQDGKRARVVAGNDERQTRVGTSKGGGWRSTAKRESSLRRSHSFGEKADFLKLLHSSYDDCADTKMPDPDQNVRRNSVSIAQGDDLDSEAASAANTPSSDLGEGPLSDCNQKKPIYSHRGIKDRRLSHHHQHRHFPTSSYEVTESAQADTAIPPVLPRWGSELSLAKLSMGPRESVHPPSPQQSPEAGSSPSAHQPPAMSPAMRCASRRSSQGDVSPCLHAVSVNGKEGVQELRLTPSYMHHRGNSPMRISSPSLAAHRRETSPARGPPRRTPWLQREGSPTRGGLMTRSFLHREGSPTRDSGCKKKKNLSPNRRRAVVSPRARRTAPWQDKWGSMSVLSPQSYDDDLGAKVKERLELLKTFSLPACNEPRRRQAQPVTMQPWPARDEERFAVGKAQLIGMEMNPFEFSADDLCHLTLEIFIELDLPDRLGIHVDRLQRFILAVRDRMYENPYHNWMHVFDVTRTVYSLAHMSGVLGRLTDWERMGLITATLCHDLEHPGVNNLFLSKSNSALAKMYKDAQVLEKHHSLRAFELMVDEEVDLLRGLNTSRYYEYRTMVTRAIMATDMAQHAQYVQKLEQTLAGSLVPDKQLEVELLIKSADTSNVLKPFDVAKRWAIRITDEFFLQGDLERQGGMEVTRMCDRDSQSRVGMQKGFIDFVIGPFFCKMEAVYPGLAPCVEHMRVNRATWDRYTDEMLLAEVDDKARYSFLPSPPVSQSTFLTQAASC